MKLAPGGWRAIRAVEAGLVVRTYKDDGNTLHSPGISSAVLWKLDAAGLIRDTSERTKGSSVVQVLTKAGAAVIAAGT